MTYQVKQAPFEATLIEVAVKTGRPIPQVILDEPELRPWLRVYLLCYLDLRQGIDAHNALRWRDVQYWCDTYGIDGLMARNMHRVTHYLDTVWATLIPKRKQ